MLIQDIEDGSRLIAFSLRALDANVDKGPGTPYGLLGLRVALWAKTTGKDLCKLQPLFLGKTLEEGLAVFTKLQAGINTKIQS